MKKRSDKPQDYESLREKIIGLGERSVRKSYYPKLREQLQELERFRTLLDQSNDAIFLMQAPSGAFMDVNEAACRMLSYPRERLLALSFEHVADQKSLAPVHELLKHGRPETRDCLIREITFVKKTGETIPAEISVSLVSFSGSVYAVAAARDVTDRKRAEEALRTSEENYRSIFDSANDAIFVHDINTGEVISINEKTKEMFGRTLDEARNFGNQDLFADVPGYTAKDALQRMRLAAEGQPQLFEWLTKKKTGEQFWVEVNLKRAVIGGKQRLLAMVRDITARKRVEEQLKQLSHRNELILDSAGEGIFGLDLQGNYTFINKAAAAMLGYKKPEELLGKHSHSCIHYIRLDGTPYPEDQCRTYASFRSGTVTHVDDECFCRKDGSTFPVEYTSMPIREDGEITGAVVTFSDITERKRAEESLRESEWRLAFATSLANEAIWDWDLTSDRISRNEVYEKMCGHPPEAGSSAEWWRSRIKPEDRERVVAAFADVVEGKQDDLNVEYRFLLADGTWGIVHDRAKVIRNSRGKPVRIVGTMQNITERKQVENRIRESEANLRTILDSVHDAIFIHKLDGTIIDVNEKMLELYRVDREQALRSRILEDFSAPENPFGKVPDIWKKAVAGKNQLFEWKARRPSDNSVFDAEVFLGKISLQSRELILANVRDITARKSAEDALRRSEANYREIFESVNDGIFVHDIDTGEVLSVNRKTVEMFGYAQEEFRQFISESLFTGMPGYTAQDAMKRMRRAAEGPPQIFEWLSKKKNGELFWVEVNLKRAVIGGETRLLAIVRDITERKRAESELTRAYNLTRTIIDSMNDAVSLIDVRDFTVVAANNVFLQNYGYASVADVAGKHCYQLTHHRTDVCSPPDDICPLLETVKSKEHFSVDHVHYDKQGNKIFVEVSTAPIKDEAGNVVQVVHIQRNITERKRAEESLRESEERFRSFFELAAVGTTQVDPATMKFMRTNRRFSEMTGYTAEELRTMSFNDLTHPEDREIDKEKFSQTLQPGAPSFETEKRYIRKDGRVIWVHVSATVVRNAEGKPLHTAAIVQDITARKAAEEALRISESRFRNLFKQSSLSMQILTPEGRTIEVNHAFEELWGLKLEALKEYNVLADEQLAAKGIMPYIKKGFSGEATEIPITQYDPSEIDRFGRARWVKAFIYPVKTGTGLIHQVVLMHWDVTEMVSAQKALRESEERFRAFFELAAVGAVQADPVTGRFFRVNDRFCRFIGYSREELESKKLQEMTHPDDREQDLKFFDAIRKGSLSEYNAEKRYLHKDGRTVWGQVSVAVIRDSHGRPVRTAAIIQDITRRKHAEEALRRSEEFLRRVLDNLIAFVAVLNHEGILLEVNRSALEVAGLSTEDVLGKRFEDTFWFTWSGEAQALVHEAIQKGLSGELSRFDMKIRIAKEAMMPIDFMLAPIRDEQGRITHLIPSAIDITGRKLMEEEIKHMAHHDPLTGLPNRRLFRDIIDLELAQARRNRKKLAVLFLDLDRFKQINDTLGHEAGDWLLKQVADRFRRTIRTSDSVARIGGDEFNIILSDIARGEDVSDICRKIVDSLREPFVVGIHSLHATTSIGISVYPDDSTDAEDLLRYADIAMYYAKDSGRNTFRFYNASINVSSLERMKLESWLRQAVQRSELIVHYQPQIDIRSRKVKFAEALVRWNHPERGLLEPGEFIPLSEETGLITAIDEWVLRTVCAQARAWKDEGLDSFCVTVNLSTRQFQSPDLVNMIKTILRETGMPSPCLDIEITESLAMKDVEQSASQLRELREMGIHISVDDFGTGYSSLNYLKKLPIERIKIDKSFIRDIATDPDDRAIITAVTSMAHKMGIRIVAEGVETEEQLSFLRDSDCDEAQGFLFSKPVPAEQFRELIRTGR